MLRDEAELLALFLREEFGMSDNFFLQHDKVVARYIMEHEAEAQEDKVEVAIGRRKTAMFYREAGEVLLECEESAFYLDREEAYRLLSLLEAEFKGSVV